MTPVPDDPPFDLTVRDAGGFPCLAVEGELDLATADRLEAAAAEQLATGGGRIVLDLSEVTFLDSTGLSVLLRVRRRAERMILVTAAPVDRVLGLVGLEQHLELAPSAEAAADRLGA